MRALGILVVLVLGVVTAAGAQSVSVDINRAQLNWTWAPAAGSGAPTQFLMKCGQVSGQYSRVSTIADPTVRSIAVKTVIGGQGNWFCAVSAANSFGESGLSNEVPFVAGAAPSGSAVLSIVAQ
jgi:hypothetical protein